MAAEQYTNQDEKISLTQSTDIPVSSSTVESANVQQTESSLTVESVDMKQTASSSSLTESSTITESSSSESANSLQATLSIPSSESTIIGPIIENTTDEVPISITKENEIIQSDDQHQSETSHSLTSDKLDVIDSWINNRENNTQEYVS